MEGFWSYLVSDPVLTQSITAAEDETKLAKPEGLLDSIFLEAKDAPAAAPEHSAHDAGALAARVLLVGVAAVPAEVDLGNVLTHFRVVFRSVDG